MAPLLTAGPFCLVIRKQIGSRFCREAKLDEFRRATADIGGAYPSHLGMYWETPVQVCFAPQYRPLDLGQVHPESCRVKFSVYNVVRICARAVCSVDRRLTDGSLASGVISRSAQD